jgi:hypothetical protein
MRFPTFAAAVALVGCAAPAAAADQDFEFWLNPSAEVALDGDTALELETAQRLRSADSGRVDTYYFRLWLKQNLNDDLTVAGAVERRINDGGRDETRIMQQLSVSPGMVRGRLRLEQRFIEGSDRMGLRLRSRLGISVPLDAEGAWSAGANSELFWVLQPTSAGGETGLVALRSVAGIEYAVSERLTLGLGYLRQQDFIAGRADTIGHAPLIELGFSF